MFCHSRDAVYVRNALRDFPADLRKRIRVIAIAIPLLLMSMNTMILSQEQACI